MVTTISFYTLGCKSNQYDSEVMKRIATEKGGYRVVPFGADADVSVINTCSVTTGADRKSRKYVRKAARKGETVLVTGCYVTLDSDVLAEIDGVDLIFPNSHKYEFGGVLDKLKGGYRGMMVEDDGANWDLDSRRISRDRNHARAFLKVQDGCSNRCTFCKTRYLRGPNRSKTPDAVVKEAGELGSNGYEEIVLTGVNLAEYEGKGLKLADLIEKLSRVDEISRIRLSSINPAGITRELLEVFDSSEKTCPYFHVPLQSGSNRVLDSMDRNYTRESYLKRINWIEEALPDSTFGTDLMVGFPGEAEEDLERTKEVVRRVGFLNAHVFRYTPREVTPAAELEDDLHSSRKKERAKELRELASGVGRDQREEFEGRELEMVLEGESGAVDGWRGYSRNYLDLHLPADRLPDGCGVGQPLRVELEEAREDYNLVTPKPVERTGTDPGVGADGKQ